MPRSPDKLMTQDVSGSRQPVLPTCCARPGVSLIEAMVVMTILGILVAFSVPSYRRAVEQSRVEIAAANLRAIWSAQRLYWLENHTYASTLGELATLLDPSIMSSTTPYTYTITSADSTTFSAVATRTGSSQWIGQLSMDQTGVVSGSLQASGEQPIAPGSP